MTPTTTKRVLAATALILLSSSSAFAVDAQAFADRLQVILGQQNLEMAFSSAEESGENVLLRGVTFTTDGEPSEPRDLTFNGVTGSPEEGFTVETVPIEDVSVTDEDTVTTISGMVIEGLQIAGTNEGAETDGTTQLFFTRAAVGEVNLLDKGEQAFNLSGLEITNEVAPDGSFTSDFDLGTFSADFSTGEQTEGTQALRDLDYLQIGGKITGSGTWSPATGELSLSPLDITVNDAGSLSLAYTITGYTPAFIESLTQLQKQMAEAPEGGNASGMAMLGLVSQLYLKSAEISFEDASLTDRLLDYYAKQNNQSRDELVASLNGMLPIFLGYLQNPEFQAKVASAVQAFLQNSESLTISIAPDAPVPATQIIGAAMGAPQTLPAVLQLEVTANQ